MKVFHSVEEFLSFRPNIKGSLGFCPTMGALHMGHISLTETAKKDNDYCLVSIFLNPTQFNNKDDLEKYPVDLEGDLLKLENAGVDYVLLPKQEEVYKDKYRFKVTENDFSNILCGAHRPGHFEGVLSVVLKLLNIARADRAYFGEKDFQQYLLIRDMAESFFLPTQIISVPTLREESGLALSSRNKRLSDKTRKKASLVYNTIIRTDLGSDEKRKTLEAEGFEVEYLTKWKGRTFIAVKADNIRLIDNV